MTDSYPAPPGLYAPYAAWREAALADGWEETPGGPWGIQARDKGIDRRTGQLHHTGERRPGDNSIKLIKGEFIIELIDRVVGLNSSKHGFKEQFMMGWARKGHQVLHKIPEVYSWEALKFAATLCTNCGKPNLKNEPLHPYSFAGMACSVCDTSSFRAKVEPPGWAD